MANYYEKLNHDGRESSALERAIIERKKNTFLFSTSQPYVWLGKGVSSNVFIKDNPENIPMTRYNGTCGALYLDENNIKINLLVDDDGGRYITSKEWVKKSLEDLGVFTTTEGDTDPRLLVEDKKIMGITAETIGTKNFVVMYILVDVNYSIIPKVLTAEGSDSVLPENAIGINEVVDTPITIEQIRDALKNRFAEFFGESLKDKKIPQALINSQNKKLELYNSDEWIKYGRVTKKPDYV